MKQYFSLEQLKNRENEDIQNIYTTDEGVYIVFENKDTVKFPKNMEFLLLDYLDDLMTKKIIKKANK